MVQINVIAEDLVVVTNRGTSQVSNQNQILVDATESYDPDTQDNTGITYNWSCQMDDGATCVNIAGATILGSNSTQGSINFPVNTFIDGSSYALTVQVSKDTRSSSKTITLTGVAAAGADLLLVPLPSHVVQQNPVRLNVAETTNNVVNYSWSMKQGPSIPTYASPTNLSYLVIAEGALQAGYEYVFTLTANVNGAVTTADASFTVNHGPTDGTVSVSPTSGIESETDFTMKADGWRDKDELNYPLTYAWKYVDANGEKRDIQSNLLANTLTKKLIGISPVQHLLQIVCAIYDNLDQHTDAQTSITLSPNPNRDQISSQAIAGLTTTDVDEIPGIINTNGAVGENSQDEVNQLFDAYSRWNTAQTGAVNEGKVETSVNMMVTLIQADGTDERTEDILQFTNEVATLSHQVGGLFKSQANQLLQALDSFTSDSDVISSTVELIGEAVIKSMLPGEDPFTRSDENSDTTHIFKRVNPSQLVAQNATSYQAETGEDISDHRGSIQVPSNLLANVTFQTADSSNAVIDVHFNQAKPTNFTSQIENKNFYVDYKLKETGAYGSDGILVTYETPSELEVSGLEGDQVKIEIEVKFLNAASTFGCYFEDGKDADGNSIWSTDGCEFEGIDTERSVIQCKCNHLTRFTSLEDVDNSVSDIVLRTPVAVEDDTEFSNFPIMFGIAIALWIIMGITIVIDCVVAMEDQRISEKQARYSDVVIGAENQKSNDQQSTHRQMPTSLQDRDILDVEAKYRHGVVGAESEGEQVVNPAPAQSVNEEDSPSQLDEKKNSSICRGHLIFGIVLRGWPTGTIRAAVVCGAYLVHICLIGLFYHETESVEEEYDDVISMSDMDVGPLFWIAVASAVGAFIISCIVVVIHLTRSKILLAIHLFFLAVATFGIGYMSFLFNTNWSLHWLAAFMISGFLEFVVAQTLLWPIVSLLYKPSK